MTGSGAGWEESHQGGEHGLEEGGAGWRQQQVEVGGAGGEGPGAQLGVGVGVVEPWTGGDGGGNRR